MPAQCTHTSNPAPGCFYSPANPCNSPTPAPVGSQSPEWTLVAFLDSYSFPLSFSPPHLVFFSLLPPLTSFAPQLPSSPPSSCSPALLMEHWATHERRQKPIFSPPRPTSWTPTTLQPPSDFVLKRANLTHIYVVRFFDSDLKNDLASYIENAEVSELMKSSKPYKPS